MSRQHLISGELNIVASEDGSGDGYWVTFVPRQRGHPPCDMRNERCPLGLAKRSLLNYTRSSGLK